MKDLSFLRFFRDDPTRRNKQLLWMIVTALALRLAVIAFIYKEQLPPGTDHFLFGFEVGRIARSIAQGNGFSSPLFADTGPTAWMPPVYPYLVAGVFKTFGVYTSASAIVILSLQAMMSAVTCLPIYFIALKSFGRRTALWAGWFWVFLPYEVYFPGERIWPTWLATLLLTLLFLMALQLEEFASPWTWTIFGLLWGVAALTEAAVMSVLPPLTLWAGYRLHTQRRQTLMQITGRMAFAAVAFCLVVSPWFVRNYRTFHQFVPFRDNFGLELRLGNTGNNYAWTNIDLGPWDLVLPTKGGSLSQTGDADRAPEWQEFKTAGEIKYMAHKEEQGLKFIGSHPGFAAWSTVRRIGYFWTGFWSIDSHYLAAVLGPRCPVCEPLDRPSILLCTGLTVLAFLGLWRTFRSNPAQAIPYVLVLLFFPLVYYITHPELYVRRPLDPLLVILTAYALVGDSQRRTDVPIRSAEKTRV